MTTRRGFCAALGSAAFAAGARAEQRFATAGSVSEFSLASGKTYADPFNDVEVDVVFAGPNGFEVRAPAFWAGGQTWRIRYSLPAPGRYQYRSVATDTANADLHNKSGTVEVTANTSSNPLYREGAIRVAADRRHFEHASGKPFFWLGDTWWMGLTKRLHWPDDFEALTTDRVKKGFTVVQIIAGLYPDMPPFDQRGANEAGFPWEPDYARINPAYFDMADARIQHLVDRGIVPCIVGCWGYFLPLMGQAKMQKHWRYLIARWGAYPVVWCLAGEGAMPYYLSKTPKEDGAAQKTGWTAIARYVRQTDPNHRLITIHPSKTARGTVDDPAVLDFDMLQTGHGDRNSIPNTVNTVTDELAREPKMPVLVGEVCYEGIMEASRQEVQRFMFWSSILSGAAGHTYGANGLWQVNREEKPFGPSPHGRSWGNTPWNVAAQLPGSKMLGAAKQYLMQFDWPRFEPHPEWVSPHWTKEKYVLPYAAGIPGSVRVIFSPPMWDPVKVQQLEPGVRYEAYFFDPAAGVEQRIGPVQPDTSGTWTSPITPTYADWVLTLKAR